MKWKRIMVILRLMLLIALIMFPNTTLAASSEVVTVTGSGTIGESAKSETKPVESSGVGTVSKVSAPKTGDWNKVSIYAFMYVSGLVVLLFLLLLKWHREERREMYLQKY